MATRISSASRNAAANGIVDLIDAAGAAGTLELRTGAQPATADDVATGTLLATFTLPRPCFGNAAAGVATAAAIATVQGVAAGTAAYFRVKDSAGATIIDGSVTATGAGGDLTLNTTTVSVGVDVGITSWTVTMPAA